MVSVGWVCGDLWLFSLMAMNGGVEVKLPAITDDPRPATASQVCFILNAITSQFRCIAVASFGFERLFFPPQKLLCLY